MIYRLDKYGNQISQLGFGCMRFKRKDSSIDYLETEKQLMHAIDCGINYFDTAYIYPGSEECIGKIFKKNNVREKINIATKLPQYLMHSLSAVEKTFNEECARLCTDYIDYYLMHMFTDYAEWEKLVELGIEEWISKKKENGQIRNIGFSYHGDSETFIKILSAYDWDFCQIQYNYLDENTQAGLEGLKAARERKIPVVIMEPLRGGKLVNLPASAMKLLSSNDKHYQAAELGLKWLYNQEGIMCVLSGMNSMAMLDENIRTASSSDIGCLSEDDFELIEQIKAILKEKEKVGCTGCRYCQPCPMGINIPAIFHYYNLMHMEKKNSARMEYAQVMGLRKDPCFADRCIGCGKCESHCPQHLRIRDLLKEADRELRPLPFKIGIFIANRFIHR